MRASTTLRTWPEVSPFFQSLPRLRDQKVASPLSSVAWSASAFMCATMSTVPSGAVQTAVIRPAASYFGSSKVPVSRLVSTPDI